MYVVYTYKKPSYKIHSTNVDKCHWLKRSTESAKKVGYKTALYTDDISIADRLDIDDIQLVEDTSYVWDSFKILALRDSRYPDYFLADYDIIFNKALEFDTAADMIFDIVEDKSNWNNIYKTTTQAVQGTRILNDKPYWNPHIEFSYNIGILKFNNPELQSYYIKEWLDIETKLKSKLRLFDLRYLTPFISQYILTLIALEYNCTHIRKPGKVEGNEFYDHFVGQLKQQKKTIL